MGVHDYARLSFKHHRIEPIEELTMSKPSGLIAAVHTPVTSDFQLNLDVVEQQAELLLSNGCTGSYVAGTTGECHSLTCKQRLDLAQRWYDVIHETSLYQINHVGSNILSESVELAAHSESLGIDGIAAMAPCFFRPTSVDELIAYLKPIADAAPSTPLYFYDIPVMTHVELSMVELLERAETELPTLAGLKYTNDNLDQLQQIMGINPDRYTILFGFDSILSSAWLYGVRGAVGGTYNWMSSIYIKIMEALKSGDTATAATLQKKTVDIITEVVRHHGFAPASKAIMKMYGVDCGPTLSPLTSLTDEEYTDLHNRLEAVGQFEL